MADVDTSAEAVEPDEIERLARMVDNPEHPLLFRNGIGWCMPLLRALAAERDAAVAKAAAARREALEEAAKAAETTPWYSCSGEWKEPGRARIAAAIRALIEEPQR